MKHRAHVRSRQRGVYNNQLTVAEPSLLVGRQPARPAQAQARAPEFVIDNGRLRGHG